MISLNLKGVSQESALALDQKLAPAEPHRVCNLQPNPKNVVGISHVLIIYPAAFNL